MRLGAPIEETYSPEAWIASLQQSGYRAAYCPLDANADTATRQAYLQAAQQANIVNLSSG